MMCYDVVDGMQRPVLESTQSLFSWQILQGNCTTNIIMLYLEKDALNLTIMNRSHTTEIPDEAVQPPPLPDEAVQPPSLQLRELNLIFHVF